MERNSAHHLLLQLLSSNEPAPALQDQDMEARIEQHLLYLARKKEAGAEALFADLAAFTADAQSH